MTWTKLAGGTSEHIAPAQWMEVGQVGFGVAANGSLSASINGEEIFAGVQPRCKGLMQGFAAVGTHLNQADFDDLSVYRIKK